MAREQYRNFMDYMWVQKEDNVYTIGLNEDALETIEKISDIDLPPSGEAVEPDVVVGSLETQDGPLDLYVPVSGVITEVNNAVIEDPSLIQDDPYDSWLLKIESEDELSDEEEEDDEDEDEDDEEDDDLDEDEEYEDEEE